MNRIIEVKDLKNIIRIVKLWMDLILRFMKERY